LLETIKKVLNKRKAKVFVLFLLASGLIWFLNTLSETYIAKTTFKLDYVNTNQNLMLTKAFADKVDVKLQTMGFQFLGFNFKKKSVKLDLATVERSNGKYYLLQEDYRNQIDKQLSNSMVLIEISSDTLFFDFLEMISKKVPVQADIKVNLAHNYLLDGVLKIEPSSITITGPKEEIDTIVTVHTVKLDQSEIVANFSEKVTLFKSSELRYTSYSSNIVQLQGKVSKFSEKIIDVPVEVINLPAGKQVRTFPDEVSILCKAKIEQLKDINGIDFKVVADYSSLKKNRSKSMALILTKQPSGIFSATLMETKVEYILNQE